MPIESNIRLEKVHQAFDRHERGSSVDGSKLTAEEIVMAIFNPRLKVALMELRPLVARVKPLALRVVASAQRFSVFFS